MDSNNSTMFFFDKDTSSTESNSGLASVERRKVIDHHRRDYRYDIAVLRLLCIAIVVFFHAYGMTYVHFSDTTNAIYAEKYEKFNQTYLINIAMPMFIFISGFLFGGQLMRQQPITFAKMLKSKFIRLMVPFFVFTVLFMFTQNAVSIKPFYQWTYSHLWFLPMLFWCFVATYFLRPLIMNDSLMVSITTIVLLFAISFLGKIVPMIFGLHNLNTSIGWFALGVWFYKHERELMMSSASSTLKVTTIVGGLIIYFVGMTIFPMEYGARAFTGFLFTICAMYSFWLLFSWIPWRNFAVTDFLLSLSACSFGIYIFHNWLEAHMVSRTVQAVLGLEQMAADHVYIFPIVFSTIAFLLSWVITWILLKFKIGQRLIG